MTTTPNTDCKITNNSGQPIVVLNAFDSSTNVAANSTKQGYMQDLKTLPLDGGSDTTIASGKSGTVTLNETYVDSKGKTRPSYIYDLLISKPDSLFPVMTVGERISFPAMTYPDITVTEAAAANMAKAFSFQQNIMTSPSSKMAKAFQTAMTDAFKKGSIQESEAAVAAFFNEYPAFAGLDFPSYVAVSTWMRGFAYTWGMDSKGKANQTYYVYSAPAKGKKGTTSEGTITFTKRANAPSPADPTDRSSGFDITLKASSGTTTPLSFADGQVVDGTKGAITLNGGFGFKGTFTGKDTDATVIPILTGTMLGTSVIAIPIAPESGWDKFWNTLTFDKVLGYFLKAMGVWMAIDFLKTKLAGKDKKEANDEANENEGEPANEEQQAEAEAAGEEIGDAAQQENQAQADNAAGPDGNVDVPADEDAFDNAVEEVRADAADAYNDVAGDNIGGGIDEAGQSVGDLAQIGNNEALEEAEGNLVDAQSSLADGNLSDANSSLGDVTEALPGIVDDMGNEVSQEMQDQIEESVSAQEEASEVADEASENADDAETGDEDPFEGGEVPEL